MLAVTILSVGLVIVVRSFVTSLRAIKISHNLLVANLLLEEKLWQRQEKQARVVILEPEEEQSEFDPPFDNFSYDIKFEEQEQVDPSSIYKLYQGSFVVSWQQRKNTWSTSCLTYSRRREE